ncbi:hypothetical protein HY090_02790 [Candidatus Kaiserbacteria bacterium]|nr:hypothetical protein [Candidatus Kaiserbacteria bacterium]
MKNHTREEKRAAKAKLPPPIGTFIGSQSLSNIYLGIEQKLKLNLRQLMIMCEIANLTLMGLESEQEVETNLHQLLPELSNADTKELVADLNDRVFKEVQRRLRDNIIEAEPEEEPEETQVVESAPLSAEPLGIEYVEQTAEIPIQSRELKAVSPSASVSTSNGAPAAVPAYNPLDKLSVPTTTTATQVALKPEVTGIQKVSLPNAVNVPAIPPAPKEYKGVDPYREAIE